MWKKAGMQPGVMVDLLDGEGKIVELAGTLGSAPANDRAKGFREILADYSDMHIMASQSADFYPRKR